MQNLVISFSGGRTSGMMAYHIQNSPKYSEYNKLFIFANTGKEREETLVFVDRCDKEFGLNLVWVKSVVTLQKGVGIEAITTNFEKASRQGEPFAAVIEKTNDVAVRGVPCMTAPYCSTSLKKTPIEKYAREYFGTNEYYTAIGFRYEDMRNNRVTMPEIKGLTIEHDKRLYPLLQDFDTFITQKEVLEFWRKQAFDLNLQPYQSNCDLCYKKPNKLKMKLLKEQPEVAQWWIEQEKKWGGSFHYNQETTEMLLEKSKMHDTLNLFEPENEVHCIC